ncbi:MAG: hypothetical protein VCC04_04955 [Myxococcota bacterium]
MHRVRRFFVITAALAAASLFSGSSASASMHLFRQMLTSDLMSGPANYSLELRADTDDAGNIAALVSNTATAGAGLGAGTVDAEGSLSYSHSFGGADAATRIVSAYLSVLTVGRGQDGSSYSEITLDDNFWVNRAMRFHVLGGQVDAELFDNDGDLVVNVTAHGGEMELMWSMFRVNYEIDSDRFIEDGGSTGDGGGISAAIPEPGAATLFAAGLLVVGSAIRRR